MKTKFIKNIAAVTLLIFTLASCELTDVTDVDPVYQVSEDKVITTLDQAQTVLYGTYGILIDGLEIPVYEPGVLSLMGGTMEPGSFAGAAEQEFFKHEVNPDNFYLESIYSKLYFLINNANHIIEKTGALDTEEDRKQEIIAQAKVLRALADFKLLRMFGEFYDLNSEYGIVLKEEPISDATPQSRATVSETYDSIIEDLDYGIAHAPEMDNTFFISNLYAAALESKVYLYMGKYDKARDLAKSVLDDPEGRELEDTFADIFTKKIVDTKEVIFQTPFDNLNDRNNKEFMFRSTFIVSDNYKDFLADDTRADVVIVPESASNGKFNDASFNGEPLTADTQYFMRLAEVYLIYAEAEIRSDQSTNGIDKALQAVNKIRDRSNNPEINTTDPNQALNDILTEKRLELGAESGEEWFDLVRYYKANNIDINDYVELTSDTKLILPLPEKTVELSENKVEQNPGY